MDVKITNKTRKKIYKLHDRVIQELRRRMQWGFSREKWRIEIILKVEELKHG